MCLHLHPFFESPWIQIKDPEFSQPFFTEYRYQVLIIWTILSWIVLFLFVLWNRVFLCFPHGLDLILHPPTLALQGWVYRCALPQPNMYCNFQPVFFQNSVLRTEFTAHCVMFVYQKQCVYIDTGDVSPKCWYPKASHQDKICKKASYLLSHSNPCLRIWSLKIRQCRSRSTKDFRSFQASKTNWIWLGIACAYNPS